MSKAGRRHHSRRSGSASAVAAKPKNAPDQSDPMSLIRTFNSETNPSRPARPSPLAASQIHGMPLDIFDRIRSFPLFQSTSDGFMAELVKSLHLQLNSPNDYILTEGDEAKSMYWLVRGVVAVTSRDGESVYAELKSGAFFGEIGVLMDIPRTATIIARTKCLLLVLTREDLKKILPKYPDVERGIREEAEERLSILHRKFNKSPTPDPASAPTSALATPAATPTPTPTLKPKPSSASASGPVAPTVERPSSKRDSSNISGALSDSDEPAEYGTQQAGGLHKRRKSPIPTAMVASPGFDGVLQNGLVNIRSLLKELPLFSNLPPDLLHFLGLNVQPKSYPPFHDIIRQNTRGREVYFIVHGEVEVLAGQPSTDGTESPKSVNSATSLGPMSTLARLIPGQYFGEVVGLSLAPRRTATVRTVTAVECLVISGEVLSEFWKRCPQEIREGVESTAKSRLSADGDVFMEEQRYPLHTSITPPPSTEGLVARDSIFLRSSRCPSMPTLTLTDDAQATSKDESQSQSERDLANGPLLIHPLDPDPFLDIGRDNYKSKSRRSSLAPKTFTDDEQSQTQKEEAKPHTSSSPPAQIPPVLTRFTIGTGAGDNADQQPTKSSSLGIFPQTILVSIFQNLELHYLLRLRAVSKYWREFLTMSPDVAHVLDLSLYNRVLTDQIIVDIICPFVRDRARVINMNSCFHVTDDGFLALAKACGANLRTLKMKSVWDVSAPAILEMANKAKHLKELNLSNCRKASDILLARIIGWTAPHESNQHHHHHSHRGSSRSSRNTNVKQTPITTPEGLVFGCPQLKKLGLSYCKHVTDRFMHHLAFHGASRFEEIDLTRCTTITDHGFQFWANARFTRLRRLCLADCTYLTDTAIVCLTNAAPNLEELDLVCFLFLFFFFIVAFARTKADHKRIKLTFLFLFFSPADFLLCSIGHIAGGNITRLSQTEKPDPLLLRLSRLRPGSPVRRPPSAQSRVSLGPRMRPRDRGWC